MRTFLMLLAFLTVPAFADHKQIVVHVNGMVCAFCSQGVEKRFKKESAVDKIEINLDEKIVKVTLKHGQDIEDEKLKTILKDAGALTVESIVRN